MKLWREAAGLDYDPWVHIAAVRDKDGRIIGRFGKEDGVEAVTRYKAIAEVAKYTVKSAAIPNAEVLQVLDSVLHRRRLTAMTGLFKQADKRIEADAKKAKQEEAPEKPETPENPDIITEFYRWNTRTKTYQLVWSKRSNPLPGIADDALAPERSNPLPELDSS